MLINGAAVPSRAMETHIFGKEYWRRGNLKFIQSRPGLWDGSGRGRKLKVAYREMLGGSGHEMFDLLDKAKALPNSLHFEGVDNNPEVLMRHALAIPQRSFKIIHGDFFASTLRRLDQQIPRLGIVNADTENAIKEEWWQKHGEHLRNIVQTGSETPDFTLILNFVLGHGGGDDATVPRQIKWYTNGISQAFRGWGGLKDLLNGTDRIITEMPPKGGGLKAGIFDVYQSEGKVVRMMTVRMSFNKRENKVTFDRA